MSSGSQRCGFDENGNAVLYETDASGKERKVATKFKDGRIVFEPSYDKLDETQKEIYRRTINTCPQK